ncbi:MULTISPECIES: glycerophosphodiester phosphodiesterase family protein [unclassified Nocardioides]|uniref:glycerophosphodiester phosphodiesterase family protein n=1 Tax=unclassified Nocardioides TaxID=2615069 RepID=UPI0007010A49|nr:MULTISPECIES: glycerophosphodiester phosphodiesterase family protein [unclassified Nocardioides]KRA28128.1 glycerophosphodiester phosphodiesterase [Nocardioides sp. Root614]KRA86102.1 glycerophosphodiester phosphodiesterase [Nocardioides sp. Root682]
MVEPVETYLQPGRVLAFAHRGGAYHPEIEGLENTMAAFRHAAALGYEYLETDVHLTADGVLLAFHDDVLERVTDRTGAVCELSLTKIREARIGGREQVPTLVDLLDAFPTARFNIDIKADGAVEPLAALVRERDLWDRVLVGSFSRRRTSRFRRLTDGRVPTAAGLWQIVAFRFSPSAAIAHRLAGGEFAAFQVPHRRRRFVVVTPGFVRRAHAAGHQVHVWTIDDRAEMNDLLDRGVDGLFTDRTDVLKDVLQGRGQWLSAPD